jgi:hypothetical protein
LTCLLLAPLTGCDSTNRANEGRPPAGCCSTATGPVSRRSSPKRRYGIQGRLFTKQPRPTVSWMPLRHHRHPFDSIHPSDVNELFSTRLSGWIKERSADIARDS